MLQRRLNYSLPTDSTSPTATNITNNNNTTATATNINSNTNFGGYSLRYKHFYDAQQRSLEDKKREDRKSASKRFHLLAEETMRRQKIAFEKQKALEVAEEKHRKDVLAQRKHQQRVHMDQARLSKYFYFHAVLKLNVIKFTRWCIR